MGIDFGKGYISHYGMAYLDVKNNLNMEEIKMFIELSFYEWKFF